MHCSSGRNEGYYEGLLTVAACSGSCTTAAALHCVTACCPGVSLCYRQGHHRASPSLGCHHLHWPRSPVRALPLESLPSRSPCSRRTTRSCRQPPGPGMQNALPRTSRRGACAQRLRALCWAAMETGGPLGLRRLLTPLSRTIIACKECSFPATPLAHCGQVVMGEASWAGLFWCCEQCTAG